MSTNAPTEHDMSTDDINLAKHLNALASDASGLSDMLNAHHTDGGDIQPETLEKAAKLETSLQKVIHALTHHEHLAMGADDVWKALNVEHHGREIDPNPRSTTR